MCLDWRRARRPLSWNKLSDYSQRQQCAKLGATAAAGIVLQAVGRPISK